ncbi:hypothetical protein GCM10022226_04740 [Sphaerisporangium flaviroseum]|uniref:DUF4194 domain-containing protein n=1 Tax=Sphaerisporangium flaviroseum TaxID=509199 RepID=A0ABP7H9Q7_9ACTN
MRDVTQLVAQVREELTGELRERLRSRLHEQPTEWLVEQLMTLALKADEVTYTIPRQVQRGPEQGLYAQPVQEAGGAPVQPVNGQTPAGNGGTQAGEDHARQRSEDVHPARRGAGDGAAEEGGSDRAARIRELDLDQTSLPVYIERYRALTREILEAEGDLLDPPHKGGPLIAPEHRSAQGEALLTEAKDLLHALLFRGAEDGVRLDRSERGFLTLTIPRAKAHAVASLLRAATETGAEDTWRDVQSVPDDRAADTLLQVEYGEAPDMLIGHAITATLRLINNLEINEQALHGRVENAEETTLDP